MFREDGRDAAVVAGDGGLDVDRRDDRLRRLAFHTLSFLHRFADLRLIPVPALLVDQLLCAPLHVGIMRVDDCARVGRTLLRQAAGGLLVLLPENAQQQRDRTGRADGFSER